MKKKLFHILTIILQINSRAIFHLNRFTGCNSPLFKNPSNFFLIKINFSESCKNLELCKIDYNKKKNQCLKNFEKDLKKFCDDIKFRLLKKLYCYRLIENNIKLAKKIDLKKDFNFFEKIFYVLIADPIGPYCLEINSQNTQNCNSNNKKQIFKIYKLSNQKYVIKNLKNKKCYNNFFRFEKCDFNLSEQQMVIEEGENGYVVFKNDKGEYMNIDNYGFNRFSDVKMNIVLYQIK